MKPRTGRAAPARPPRTDAQAIQRLAGSRARPSSSKVQQRFARLIKQADQRKQRLRAWYDAQPAIHRELSAYRALFEAHQRTAHDLVILFDSVYTHPTFTKAERKRLRDMICEMAGDLLGEQGFDDLKPIYNRHSRSDFDTEAAFGNAVQAHVMKSMLEEMFGMDFGDADVSSPEKLQAFAEAQFQAAEAQQEQARERRALRKKSAKQQAREAEREAEKSRVGKVLQEVYRKLAVALHPDLEQDPAERTRKTELMQQVNVAYESQDLLRLLELQLKLEQIDADHTSEVAEDRLRHYNTILDQQVKELDAELDQVELPWRMELDLPPSAHLAPTRVLEQIHEDSEGLRRQDETLRGDLAKFQDVAQLKKWLKSPGGRRRDDDLELDLFR